MSSTNVLLLHRGSIRSGAARLSRRGLLWLALAALLAAAGWSGAPRSASAAMPQPGPKAYVGLFGDNAVAVLDTRANRVLTTIPIPAGPHGLVISPDGLRVYASSDGASTVSVISTATDRAVSSIDVGKAPHGLAMTRDGRWVLAAVFGESQVAVIDTVRNQVVARMPVGNPHNIAISPDDTTAYVASQQPGATALAILDLRSRQQVGTVPLDKTPRALGFSPDGGTLYVTLAGSDAVQVVDVKRAQIVGQIPVGASPHHPLITANGEYGLVVSQGPGQLAVISPSTSKVIGTVTVGKLPHWIATSSDGDTAYVTNEGSNSVTVVDVAKQRVLATIPVGAAPRKIVLQAGPVVNSKAAPAFVSASRVAGAPASIVTAGIPAAVSAQQPAADLPAGEVRIASFAFGPQAITVEAGTAVTWTNADTIPHTSTGQGKQWDSGPIQPGASFRMTFTKPGTYQYACTIHPFMQATLVVRN